MGTRARPSQRFRIPFRLVLLALLSLVWAPITPASAACAIRVTPLAGGFASPDDLAWQHHTLWVGDIGRGTLDTVRRGKVTVRVRHLRVPEGIVVRGSSVIVVEQGRNRLTEVNLRSGTRHPVLQLVNHTGREGVDGIVAGGSGSLIIPNSPYGTLLRLDRHGRLHRLAAGLGRPVDAVSFAGGLAVPDETSGNVWLVRRGHARSLARLDVPDDVVNDHGLLLATTLGDGRLWEVAPRLRLLAAGFGQPQGLTLTGRNTAAVADSTRGVVDRVTGLASCLP